MRSKAMRWTDAPRQVVRKVAHRLRRPRDPERNRLSRRGTAAVEFGLLTPMLMALLAGVFEIGTAAYQSMQVQAAAEAGALYAAKYGVANLAAISQAVLNATGTTGVTASPAPLVFCGCPSTTGVVSQGSNCTTACSDGTAPGQYVQVSAAIAHQTLMPFLNLPLPATITSHAVVRIL
jgi:Flp pilus assembly protein TadG